jgi:N-acetylglucosamine kinase-like BadF-type ATPase
VKLAQLEDEAVEAVHIGIPCYGEINADGVLLKKAILEGLNMRNLTMGNDVEVGWAGSLGCQPGINIVAGTGSIAYGVDESNRAERSGGWGPDFGGDEGSAYWIGCQLVQAFSKQTDGRLPRTELYDYLRKALRLNYDFDILDITINKLKMERTEIAKFSKYVCELALRGDPVALKIFDGAALELTSMIEAVIRKLDFKEKPIKVSYSGGVFKSGDLVLEPMLKYLKPLNIELFNPVFDPALGACLLAYRHIHGAVSPELLETMKQKQFERKA